MREIPQASEEAQSVVEHPPLLGSLRTGQEMRRKEWRKEEMIGGALSSREIAL